MPNVKKILTVVVSAALAVVGTVLLIPKADAVVGGREAAQPYPWLVNLTLSVPDEGDMHVCGATLISDRWAVTGGHCVTGLPAELMVVRVGSNDRTKGGEVRKVRRLVPHPSFFQSPDGKKVVADIGLVELDAPVKAQPIRIARTAPAPGTPTRIIGWGATCAEEVPACDENPVLVRELNTRISPARACKDIARASELCTGGKGAGACHGDSGGPQVRATGPGRWELVGLTSRLADHQTTCATVPSIYTSTAAYARWIARTIKQ